MSLVASFFRTWLSGSLEHIASPDPPAADLARPFAVRLGTKDIIPLNVLVFATDAEHAKRRVLHALQECCEKDYRGQDGMDHGKWLSKGRQYELLAGYRSGEYDLLAEPLDIAIMPKIQWASNGGL